MATKTEAEIEEEIKKLKKESDEKIKRMRQQVVLMRQKKMDKLGKLALDFLNGKIGKEELENFAIDNGFIKVKVEKEEVEE